MVIGTGASLSNKLTNGIFQSLMIGFGSEKPTLFIGPGGPGYTGQVGIGDVTDPQAKLHIKADENEVAELFIEPHYFTGGENTRLRLGTMDYGLSAGYGKLYFKTGGNYVFNSPEANVGISTDNPQAKLQIKDGDIFIEDIDRGIIMKSPDGNCWRGTLNNSGSLQFVQVNCDDLTTGENENPDPPVGGPKTKIYPNPAGDKVFVSINPKLTGATLEISGLAGKIVYSEKLNNAESYIDLSGNQPGMYLFRIVDGNGKVVESVKVVKQ